MKVLLAPADPQMGQLRFFHKTMTPPPRLSAT